MDTSQRLVLFADIVEQGSIAAAARLRGATRSAVSKQLANLEQETEVRLLHRNTRSMSLTGAGRMIYEQALRVRDSRRETEALIAGLGNRVAGELRITASVHLGRFLVPGAISSFTRRFPDVTPNLRLTDRTTDIIAENIDLAIRIGDLKDSRLVGVRLCGNPVVMVAAPGFLESQGRPESMSDLQHFPCVTYDSGEVLVDKWSYLHRGKEQVVNVRSAFKTNDGQLLLDACIAGHGIALLPTYVAMDALRKGQLEIVLPDVRMQDYQSVYLVYATRHHQSPALNEFLAHIRLWLQQHPVPQASEFIHQ